MHTEPIENELTLFRLSEGKYLIKVFTHGQPYSILGMDLQFIGKQKISDSDEAAVINLSLVGDVENGIEVEPDNTDNNGVIVTVPPEATEDLPATKNVTLICELLVISFPRKTLGQCTIPVRASVRQTP